MLVLLTLGLLLARLLAFDAAVFVALTETATWSLRDPKAPQGWWRDGGTENEEVARR